MTYYMNPFDFVPLPDKPKPLPESAKNAPLLEGYLEYTLTVKTPLHISGLTKKDIKRRHFTEKSFYENYGQRIIPGSSVRGMLSAFIEAVTGSDLKSYTRGDEGEDNSQAKTPYEKTYGRHVGFLMTSQDDPNKNKNIKIEYKDKRGNLKKRCKYERHETLPDGFGLHKETDVARYLFGFVDEEEKSDQREKKESEKSVANAGRLIFEDIQFSKDLLGTFKAWDLKSDAIMGGPNPRANTGWYFEPGEYRIRKTDKGFRVWEALADKVRGRKFYFHQDPASCHDEYKKWRKWMPLAEYQVNAVPAGTVIQGGRIYFKGLNETMLMFLAYALGLEPGMAHKLGALKPFGFGSVTFSVNDLYHREITCPLNPIKHSELRGRVPLDIFDPVAYNYLKRIMRFPKENESKHYLFIYPPFNSDRSKPAEERGFAYVENADRSATPGNVDRSDCAMTKNPASPPGHPEPGKSKKTTMFFDHYQMNAANFEHVMGGKDYSHLKSG